VIPRRPLLAFSRARRPRLGVLASAVIAAVVLVMLAAVYALVAGDRFSPVAPPSPTPVGSLTAPSGSPSTTLRAFVALVGRSDRTFHVETRTDVTVGDKTVTVVSALDHAGAAYAGSIDITSPNRSQHEDVVTVLPFTYVRETDGPWRSGDAPKRSLDPFSGLSSATPVAELGLETVDGRSLHHLRLVLLPVDTTFGPEVKSVVYTSTTFDVWVDDAGAPVSGTFALEGTAVVSEVPVAVTIRATFVFSRVGEPMQITAPIT
jgi:hypothetical protein